MIDRRWERATAATGFAIVALIVAALSTWGNLYYFDSLSKITDYYVAHGSQALLSQGFFLLWGLAILAFASGLRPILDRAEGETHVLSSLASGLAVLTLGWTMVFAAVNGGLASAAGQSSSASIKLLMGVEGEVDLLTFLALGLFVGVTSLAMVRGRLFARWIGWLGVVSGALLVLSDVSFLDANPNGTLGSVGNIGMGGLLLFLIWTLAVSVSLLRRSPVERGAIAPQVGRVLA